MSSFSALFWWLCRHTSAQRCFMRRMVFRKRLVQLTQKDGERLFSGSNDDCHYWSDFFEAWSPTLFRRRWSATSLYFFFKALIFSRHYLLSHACPCCCSFSAIVLSMAMFLLALSSYLLIATSDQIANNALILTSIHDIWLILNL